MKKNNKKGFTLVELLAVIVILAIILVISVPKVMSTIKKAKIGSMESSAKMIASAVEKKYSVSMALGEGETLSKTGSCMTIGDLDTNEYESCTYTIDDNGKAKVTLKGTDTGKFSGLTCTDASKVSAECTDTLETLVTVKNSFSDYTWSEIKTLANAAANGDITYSELKTTYNLEVGAERSVNLGDTLGTHTVRISNMSNGEDNTCGTSGFSETACGFVVEFVDIINEQAMNSTDTNVGGFASSTLRTYLNSTIYDSLPDDLKNVIINTFVVSGHGSSDSNSENVNGNWTSTDKIYLLSTKEIWGDTESDSVTETRQLDYYNSKGVNPDDIENLTFVIKKYNNTDSYWWLRSASNSSDTNYNLAATNGWMGAYTSQTVAFPSGTLIIASFGVSPAFRIG